MKREKQKNKNNSQSAILHSNIMKCTIVFAFGMVLLISLFSINHRYSEITSQQISDTYYLNMYRNGSTTLTKSIMGFVASRERSFRDAYYMELNNTKQREKAMTYLSENNLKTDEIEELQRIADISDELVPIEKQAIDFMDEGRKDDAVQLIFMSSYVDSTSDISTSTDEIIDKILNRLDLEKDRIRLIQVSIEMLFALCMLILFLTIKDTIKFARVEILTPIIKVSDQLMEIAKGNLHKEIELKEDESEVGTVAKSIRVMKSNWSDMIYEIAYSLEEMSNGNYALNFETEYVGEFVTIKESLEEIVNGMKKIISTISEATKDMDEGSKGLATASESLAASCTAQAMEVSDIIIYLQGIAETTRANEKDAEEAVKIAQLTRSTVDMEEERINSLFQTLDGVSHCIDEMSSVLEMIDLSDETQVLIKNTLNSLEQTIKQTEIAYNDLEDMKIGSDENTQRIERIVNNFKEEIENIDKISENLNALGTSVENNSATAEETAAISTQQKSQAENLVNLMENFRV